MPPPYFKIDIYFSAGYVLSDGRDLGGDAVPWGGSSKSPLLCKGRDSVYLSMGVSGYKPGVHNKTACGDEDRIKSYHTTGGRRSFLVL